LNTFNNTCPKNTTLQKGSYFVSSFFCREKSNPISSKHQYHRQFKNWDFKKNLTSDDWRFVAHRREKRKREGKDPGDVMLNGNLVPESKVRKAIARHVLPTSQYLGTVNCDAGM
jgi:hypothetical protein